jgi:glycosyltransferase involved in cell wall biosynthesis
MQLPLVSVVMSVKNGGKNLTNTINSILCQENVDFEFIIVNDGSNDNTLLTLNSLAKNDKRLKILSWEGVGLTRSLIRACQHASGEFIARQDANDYSLPSRLYTQANYLASNSNATMCSTYVRFITQEGVTAMTNSSTSRPDPKGFTGTIHGSVMFRKSAYLQVGGYRQEFYYAQDVDLWSRLVEIGEHLVVPDILYENCLIPGSISGSKKKEQDMFFRFIVEASELRRSGGSEKPTLIKASKFSEKCQETSRSTVNNAAGAYFIASCLLNKYPSIAKKYLEMTIQSNPFHIRARLKLSKLKCI